MSWGRKLVAAQAPQSFLRRPGQFWPSPLGRGGVVFAKAAFALLHSLGSSVAFFLDPLAATSRRFCLWRQCRPVMYTSPRMTSPGPKVFRGFYAQPKGKQDCVRSLHYLQPITADYCPSTATWKGSQVSSHKLPQKLPPPQYEPPPKTASSGLHGNPVKRHVWRRGGSTRPAPHQAGGQSCLGVPDGEVSDPPEHHPRKEFLRRHWSRRKILPLNGRTKKCGKRPQRRSPFQIFSKQ